MNTLLFVLFACGEKEEDTGFDAEDTAVEDTDTEDTEDTEDTVTEDTEDTETEQDERLHWNTLTSGVVNKSSLPILGHLDLYSSTFLNGR